MSQTDETAPTQGAGTEPTCKVTLSMEILTISPRVWSVIGEKNDNKEILNYIGHGDLRLSYKLNDQIFSLMLRNNLHFDKTNKGAAEISYMFPIFSSGVYGYLQYFTGYGESLIDYDRHTDKVGLGFVNFKIALKI